MSTAKRMLAIVGERGAINNAQVIDGPFHLSKPRAPAIRENASKSPGFQGLQRSDLLVLAIGR